MVFNNIDDVGGKRRYSRNILQWCKTTLKARITPMETTSSCIRKKTDEVLLYKWTIVSNSSIHQVIIAKWLAWRLATGEVPSSNPGKGENLIILTKKEI